MPTSLLTIQEAAERLAVSADTVRRHLPIIKIGRACRVDPAAVEAYIRNGQAGESTTEDSTCENEKAKQGTRTASTNGRIARTGGHRGPDPAAERVAARLGLKL